MYKWRAGRKYQQSYVMFKVTKIVLLKRCVRINILISDKNTESGRVISICGLNGYDVKNISKRFRRVYNFRT